MLNQCYDAHDAYFHYMHMIEELKTAGIILAMHLLPIHANSNNVDILKCQVFQENSPFQNNSHVVVALAVVISFLLLGKLNSNSMGQIMYMLIVTKSKL